MSNLNTIITALTVSVNAEIQTLAQKRDTLQRFLNLSKDVQGMIDKTPNEKFSGYERGISFVDSQRTVNDLTLEALSSGLKTSESIAAYVLTKRKTTISSVKSALRSLVIKGTIRSKTTTNARSVGRPPMNYVIKGKQTTQRR